jgi:spore cortex formation protein SpoVR/YcgB (stage V sporulation)
MNKYFIDTNKDIIPFMSEATKRFNKYERMYGMDEVEKIIDAGHSIQFHSSPFDN